MVPFPRRTFEGRTVAEQRVPRWAATARGAAALPVLGGAYTPVLWEAAWLCLLEVGWGLDQRGHFALPLCAVYLVHSLCFKCT